MFIKAVQNYLKENGLKNVFLLHFVDIEEFKRIEQENGKEVEEYFITIVPNPKTENGKYQKVEFYIVSRQYPNTLKYSNLLKEVIGKDNRIMANGKPVGKYKWYFDMTDYNGNVYNVICARDKGVDPYLYDLLEYYTFYYEIEFELKK